MRAREMRGYERRIKRGMGRQRKAPGILASKSISCLPGSSGRSSDRGRPQRSRLIDHKMTIFLAARLIEHGGTEELFTAGEDGLHNGSVFSSTTNLNF